MPESVLPVVIVGGGPAGAATAVSLAARGVRSLVLEAAESVERKVGETVPPALNGVMDRLGMGHLLREPEHLVCYGNEFLWGGKNPVMRHFLAGPHGNGRHLDRQIFERELQCEAEERGVEWRTGCRVVRVARSAPEEWRLIVAEKGEERELRARFLVDATGRASRIARLLGQVRRRYDRLVGVVFPFRLRGGHRIPQLTFIEGVENGWWYGALLPGDALMTSFMTDSDLLGEEMGDADFYRCKLASTALLGSYLNRTLADSAPLIPGSAPMIRPASTSHLPRLYGDGWLAVGDAACAYDPISSYGILSALGGGLYAGHGIADHLEGKPEALPAYAVVVGEAFEAYLEMARNQYALENRWPENPFWQRRGRRGEGEVRS